VGFSFRKGAERKRTKKERRIRNRTVAIDESGDLGGGMYTIVAGVIRDTDEFERAFKHLKGVVKAYDAGFETQKKVLIGIEKSSPDIYAVPFNVSKSNIRDAEDRKRQHIIQTEELLELVFSSDAGTVVDVLFDENNLIDGKVEEFVDMCIKVANQNGKIIDWLEMKPSATDQILKVHDYLAYAVGGHYQNIDDPEHDAHKLFDIIRNRFRGK
jgi:hypothetical protein